LRSGSRDEEESGSRELGAYSQQGDVGTFFSSLNDVQIKVDDVGNRIIITSTWPGFERDSLKVDLEGGDLVLMGEKSLEHRDKSRGTFMKSYQQVKRRVPLPEEVDMESIKAKHKGNSLIVKIPKTETSGRRQLSSIPIE